MYGWRLPPDRTIVMSLLPTGGIVEPEELVAQSMVSYCVKSCKSHEGREVFNTPHAGHCNFNFTRIVLLFAGIG